MSSEKRSESFVISKNISWEETDKGVQRKILCYNQQLMMVHVIFEQGGIGRLHHHPHRQISFIESGSFEVQIDNEKKILHKGDSFIVKPESLHGVIALEAGGIIDIFSPVREDFL